MSQIILPNGQPVRPTKKGHDFATINDTINIVCNVAGPMAQAFEEMKAKVARLEDRLGITDETVQAVPPAGGDV